MDMSREYFEQGAVLLKGAMCEDDFRDIDAVLASNWKEFHIENPYSEECAEFAMRNPSAVSAIYDRVINLEECMHIARIDAVKDSIQALIGEKAKIYSKIPLRIDVPLETKELAVWHQDDFYVKGAPNEITAWIPLQDTPMHLGALSVMKKSHLFGRLAHDVVWGKKCMPQGVYNLPINIVEMQRGDILLFNSFLLHTSNINFSRYIRYSIQLRFTSSELGNPSNLMGGTNDF